MIRTVLLKHELTARVDVDVSALKVHMSENARDAIAAYPEFITEFRGDTCVKVEIAVSQ